MEAANLEKAKYLWGEYQYRHEHCWNTVFKLTAAVALLSIIPYTETTVFTGHEIANPGERVSDLDLLDPRNTAWRYMLFRVFRNAVIYLLTPCRETIKMCYKLPVAMTTQRTTSTEQSAWLTTFVVFEPMK